MVLGWQYPLRALAFGTHSVGQAKCRLRWRGKSRYSAATLWIEREPWIWRQVYRYLAMIAMERITKATIWISTSATSNAMDTQKQPQGGSSEKALFARWISLRSRGSYPLQVVGLVDFFGVGWAASYTCFYPGHAKPSGGKPLQTICFVTLMRLGITTNGNNEVLLAWQDSSLIPASDLGLKVT